MNIHQFLGQNTEVLRNEIISELESDFTTLDFIKKFARKFEREYINHMYRNTGDNEFKKVHGQIAKYLAENEPLLEIRKKRKEKNRDVFGVMNEIQVWEKKKKDFFKEFYY